MRKNQNIGGGALAALLAIGTVVGQMNTNNKDDSENEE